MTKITVPEVLPMVHAYRDKPGNSVGGALHLVLDDGNVSDGDVAFCRKYAEQRGDTDGMALADILLGMSRTQRNKLAALFYK